MDFDNNSFKNVQTETEIYNALGLEFVPPPLRESAETVVPAGSRKFPAAVADADVKGILHCHTTASDGRDSLRAMAEAMIVRGFEYLGIADHSQAAAYARGLSPERVREQWKEIDRLNAELAPFRILKGTEVDLQAGGLLDFDDDLLAGFDFVIASVHSGFNMTEEEATERVCRALENSNVDILGHPTGRLLLERSGYPLNHERVIACAAQHRKGIEFNCNPHRFDLDWRWLSLCEDLHVPVPLCPDAHDIAGLWDIRYGVDVAAKGPLTAANCLTTWSAERFVDWCRSHE
jgi:DNA polymerase (family X)